MVNVNCAGAPVATCDGDYVCEMVECEVCLTEIPASVAQRIEGSDYVHHFCGLECFGVWRAKCEYPGRISDFRQLGTLAATPFQAERRPPFKRPVGAAGGRPEGLPVSIRLSAMFIITSIATILVPRNMARLCHSRRLFPCTPEAILRHCLARWLMPPASYDNMQGSEVLFQT